MTSSSDPVGGGGGRAGTRLSIREIPVEAKSSECDQSRELSILIAAGMGNVCRAEGGGGVCEGGRSQSH